MPVTEIEEQTCSNLELNKIQTNQTNQLSNSNRRIDIADIALSTSPLDTKLESSDCKIRFNTSPASSPLSSCKLTPKLHFSSSADQRGGSSSSLKERPELTTDTIIDSLADEQINLRFNDEDLNNNDHAKSALNQQQADGCAADGRSKIEMKTFRKLPKGTSYESDGAYPSDQLQTHKNGKKMTTNRYSNKNLLRSVSEKSNQDNTAKQVNCFRSLYTRLVLLAHSSNLIVLS